MVRNEIAVSLTDLDRRILCVVQRSGNISHAELAERVAASAASCWRRVKVLEEAGILGPAVRLVDALSVGRSLTAICQIRMREHSFEMRTSFEEFVDAQPEILECYAMSGEWDYLIKIVAADVSDYERFLMQKLLKHSAIATSSTQFALSKVKFTTALPVDG